VGVKEILGVDVIPLLLKVIRLLKEQCHSRIADAGTAAIRHFRRAKKKNSSSRHGDKEKKEADHHPRILEILS